MVRKSIWCLAPLALLALCLAGCSPKDYHDVERSARTIPAQPSPGSADA